MKPWYKSKTIWFNLVATLTAFIAAGVNQFQPFMAPMHYTIFAGIVGAANVFLRFISTEGLTTTKE